MKQLFISLICLLLMCISCTERVVFTHEKVTPEYAEIESKDDVHAFADTLITPYIYTKVISLRKLPVNEKKQKFIEMLLPSVLLAQHNLNQKIRRVEHIENWLSKYPNYIESDSIFLFQLFEQYNCSEISELKKRLKPHPASIVLGQAALESGWGSSRFFQEGNNVFGIWSYNKEENRIKALVGRDSTHIYVRKYSSIEESVDDYYQTIARVRAYKEFRLERSNTNDPSKLVPLLYRYSEIGEAYTKKLNSLIKNNKLTQYDNYTIDDKYLQKETIELAQLNKFPLNSIY
ncbi:glucosaminidase domain-containing protein [Marinifilum fragile]|uniref:glucosaminidase domain-containing protein n=1 Tax=Marinifilum fragile TaxID=570161 RepID=UPI002AA715F0|nr:glucosaminidase domain-containing protein [Marinifilum fragile]